MNKLRTNRFTIRLDKQAFLQNCKSSGELIKAIYRLNKEANSKISLQFICDRAGIPSKGLLSDIMAGRRPLKLSHANNLVGVFGLVGVEKKLFLALVRWELERSPVKAKLLEKQVEALKDQL